MAAKALLHCACAPGERHVRSGRFGVVSAAGLNVVVTKYNCRRVSLCVAE